MMEKMKLKSTKYQYSDLLALPVKSKYCLRAFRYQCMGCRDDVSNIDLEVFIQFLK